MQIKAEEISSIIQEKIKGFDQRVDVHEMGHVIQVGDNIAKVYGLEGAMSGELLEFPGNLFGVALNLEEDSVGVVLLGEDKAIREGDPVKRTGRIAEVPWVKGWSDESSMPLVNPSTEKARSKRRKLASSKSEPRVWWSVSRSGNRSKQG